MTAWEILMTGFGFYTGLIIWQWQLVLEFRAHREVLITLAALALSALAVAGGLGK